MFNNEFLKRQIQTAIDIAPTRIELKRKSNVDNGHGCYEDVRLDIATFNAVIDKKSSSYKIALDNGGSVERLSNVKLKAVVDDNFTIQSGDYFYLGATTYSVVSAVPIAGVVWDCDLDVMQ